MRQSFTRRQVLAAAAAGSTALMGSALLAACGGSAPAPAAAPTTAAAAAAAPTTAPAAASAPTAAATTSAATAPTAAVAAAPTTATAATAAPQPAAGTKATQITVWWGTGPTQNGVAADFQKANPGIKVQLAELGENVYGNPKYLAAVAAGTGPDASYQNRHTFHEFSSQGLYKDLSALYAKDGFKESDIGPEQWKELTWNGKLYGIPYNVDGRYFFWNTQHFQDAGLDPAKGPATWNDIEVFAAKLTKKSGSTIDRYGFLPGFPAGLSDQLLIFGLETGAKTYDPNGKKVLFVEDPGWADSLTWVKQVYDTLDGGSQQATAWMGSFSGQTVDPFAQGKVSMTSYGSWMISGYAAYPDLKYNGSFAMPVAAKLAGQKVNWSCDYSFVMDPHTKNEEQSWLFTKFATGKDGMNSLATTGLDLTKQQWQREKLPGTPVFVPSPVGLLPVNEWLKTSPFVTGLPEPQKSLALQTFDGVTWATGCGNIGWLVAAELWNGFKNAWDQVVTNQRTPKDALANVTPAIQTALDKAWERIAKASG